tara:strand:- start:152 stop:535 length:384 start_codon:yes stop_codon:yes gene_type:complete
MKRFLPLFILTGLLFGQDVLTLKNGESYNGTFFGKVDEDIVFKVEGETSTKKLSINDVNTIVTKNGELTYPFDDPNMKSTEYKEWDYVSPLEPVLKPVMYGTLTVAGTCFILYLIFLEILRNNNADI